VRPEQGDCLSNWQAAFDPRRLEEYEDQIEKIDPRKLKEYEEATGIALARGHVDFSEFQARNLEIEEKRLMPRYVEEQFLSAAKEVGLRVERRADGLYRIEHVLADLRSDRLKSVEKLGKADSSYRKVTFHKQHLEQDQNLDAVLLGPGHPLYSAVDEKLNNQLAALNRGVALYADPLAEAPYRLHFFEIIIKGKNTRGEDTNLYRELVAVREDSRAGGPPVFEKVPADFLLNLPPHPNPPDEIEPIDHQPACDFLKSTYQLERRGLCQDERKKHGQIVREYLENSFRVRIKKAQERAMKWSAEAHKNPSYQLAADEAKREVEELMRSQKERLSGLSRLEIARTGPVRHVASVIVLSPDAEAGDQLVALAEEADPNIRRQSEIAAEDVVIAALVKEGFPEENIKRVGQEKIGFDIRAHRVMDESTGEIEVRRIEVKGRMRGQPIRLTVNEWYKAQQLATTYFLAVVWDPLTDNPELVILQNPAEKLDHAKKEIVAARFFEIPAEAIKI